MSCLQSRVEEPWVWFGRHKTQLAQGRFRDGWGRGRTMPGGLVPFEALFQQHFAFVWRCLRTLGVCAADIDDVTQEVFIVAHRRLAEFESERALRPWLYGILRHVASNHRRGRRRARQREDRLHHEPPPPPPKTPIEALEAQEAADLVTRTLQKLEPNRREVFLLVEVEQLPIPEVAVALDIPINTAYSRLRLARADFQAALLREGAL